MMHGRTALTLLTAALVAGPMFAQERTLAPKLLQSSRARALELRETLGLDDQHDFAIRRGHTDFLGQTHTRLDQKFHGVKVWGGELITHVNADGTHLPMTKAVRGRIGISVRPTLDAKEALGLVHMDLNPKGPYAYEPTSELVIFNDETTAAPRLAFHVHTELENGVGETAHTDYMIDAHSGATLKKWSTLRTTDAVGTGNSQHSGTVSIHTNLSGSTYQLYDTYRGMNIKTYNLNHATSGTGTLYTDADNTWGDGNNYPTGTGTSTTGATGQTAAVDAHYGVEMTYDFYKNVLGRNGIDGNGTATYSRVHYSTSYDNAFWSDSCFCMTYGDGSEFKQLASMDVAAHEMSHGVCANTANLNYSGESGGLNEANSDIFGAMVELYSRNNNTLPATVSNTNSCWTIGEDLNATPLRYMYKPSLDGNSPDAYSSSVGNLDVHYSNGPGLRMFFFLSQGASATSSSNYYSSYAPSGFAGIGPEKAIRIWYRALTTYMTTTTNYAGARTACLSAATDLYGASSAEYAAVQNAFGAINVGSLAPTGVTVAISPATATVAAGATYQFTATVSGSTTTTVTWTCTGGTVSTSGLYTAPTTAGTYTVKATSTADTTKSASATVTVTSSTGTTYTEAESNNTRTTANAVADTVKTITGYVGTTNDNDYFKVKVPGKTTLKVAMTGPSGKDYDLYLYNASGTKLKSSLGTGCTESVSYTNSSSSAVYYYIRVYGYSGTSTTSPYTLTLTR